MKTLLSILFGAMSMHSAFGEAPSSIPTVADRVRDADIIVFVSVENVTTTRHTDGTGRTVTVLAGDGVVERVLKGKPPERLKLRQEITGDDSTWVKLAKGRFLLRAKRSGDTFVPSGYYGLGAVTGKGEDADRVLWPECNSVAEAVAKIEKALGK